VGSSQRLLRLEGTAVLLAKREQRERGRERGGQEEEWKDRQKQTTNTDMINRQK